MRNETYKKIIRGFCLYDFVGLGLFAIPMIGAHQVSTYSNVNQLMGGSPVFVTEPFSFLALQLLGILVVAWGIWRWRNPSLEIGIFEGCLRMIYGPTLIAYGVTGDMPIMTLAGVADIAIGGLHLWGAWRLRFRLPMQVS